MTLYEQQKKLRPYLVDFDLDNAWQSSRVIEKLRHKLQKYLDNCWQCDPQDLEHQVLFRLTCYSPSDINSKVIENVVEEQKYLITERLLKLDVELDWLFRGLTGKYPDLNNKNRLIMHKEDGCLFAVGKSPRGKEIKIPVDFTRIEDENIIRIFTGELHYIHQERNKGEVFGFFFRGDKYPFAVETTEPSINARQYKREALLAHGINPNLAIELTRFYTLPGSPRNTISVIDSKVSKYYKPLGIEALFTTVMPAYAKTKGSTIAGGMNNVLLIKDLCHKFVGIEKLGHTLYQHATNGYIETYNPKKVIRSHPDFPLLPTVEVFMPINELSLEKMPDLSGKTIYVRNRERN
jgi:hypothetical protein